MKIDKQQLHAFARKGLRVASEVASVAVQLRADSGPLGLISVAAKAAHTLIEQTESTPFRGWTSVRGVGPLDAFTLHLAKSRHLVTLAPGTTTTQRVFVGTVHGVRLGWIEYERWIEGPYVASGFTEDQAVAVLRALTWDVCGKSVRYHQPMMGSPTLADDGIGEPYPSQVAVELWDEQREFIDAGYRRSILLAGEPGVGKTSIVRYVAERAGGHRLRLKARDLENLRSLGRLIGFLQPDAVAIDDLCRAKDKAGILDELDELMGSARLLMVTVNKLDALDGAAIRRFDAVRQIDCLDAAVLARLLDGVPDDVASRLRALPVKYVHKYREAVDVLGHARAVSVVDDLVQQHALVSKVMAGTEAAEKPKDQS